MEKKYKQYLSEPPVSKRESMVRGFGQEFTLGLSDEIEAILKTMIKYAPAPYLSRGKSRTVGEDYDEYVAATRELNRIAQEQNPDEYKSGEYGAMISQFLPFFGGAKLLKGFSKFLANVGIVGGTKQLVKTGKKVNKIVKEVSKKKIPTKEKRKLIEKQIEEEKQTAMKKLKEAVTSKDVQQNLALGTVMGGVEGFGKSDKSGLELVGDTGKGAGFGLASGLILPAVKGVAKGGKEVAKKAANVVGDIGEDITEWALQNPRLFRKARDFVDVKKNFLEMASELQKKADGFQVSAAKKLRDDQVIPREALTDPIDDTIRDLKEYSGGIDLGDDYDKALKALEDLKVKIQTGKLEGLDPATDLVTEKDMWKVYRRLKKKAEVARDKRRTQDFAPILALNLRKVRYQIRENLAKFNPEWNKEFQPVRDIEKLLGADDFDEKGIRKVFNIKYKDAEKVYKSKKNDRGVDMSDKPLRDAFSAPFNKYGLERQTDNRDLLNDFEDAYNKFVVGKKPALGPVKVKTRGKVKDAPTLLKEGEAVRVEELIDTAGPQTGYTGRSAEMVEGLTKTVSESEGMAKAAGGLGGLIKQKYGKMITAEALQAGGKPLREGGISEKTGKAIEAVSGVTGLPRVIRGEMTESNIEPDPNVTSPRFENILQKKFEQAKPGEEFGVDQFRGIKPKENLEEIKIKREINKEDLERFNKFEQWEQEVNKKEVNNRSSMFDTNELEPEEIKRRKTAINFLQQQRGLRKPKYS